MSSEDQLALADLAALAARYAQAIDSRDSDALAALFTTEAVVVVPESIAGPGGTELAPSVLVGSVARFVRTRHVVHQQVVVRTGDTARAQTYGQAHHIYRRGEELRDSVLELRYLDDFVRTSDGWRFTRRELLVDWTTDTPVTMTSVG